MHLWGQKHQMVATKATTQELQLQMVVFHARYPSIFAWFSNLVHVTLVVKVVQNSCINQNILKSYFRLYVDENNTNYKDTNVCKWSRL